MLKRILNGKSKTITSAAFILAISAIASRLLGLLRDRLLASHFGAGDELDIYYAAFRLPDLVYHIVIIGGISAAFIPVFSEYLSINKKEAWKMVSNVFNIFSLGVIITAAIFIFVLPFFISLIAPGFEGEKRNLTILLSRIMFLSPVFMGLSSIFSGILQAFKRFLVYSLTPILYNLGIIVGVLIFVPFWGLKGLALGVILGAAMHFLIQLPFAIYVGFHWQGVFDITSRGLKKIAYLAIPRIIGISASQINLLVIAAIASLLTSGSYAVFNLANNLQYVPIGIVGVSFASAAFPTLSHAFYQKRKKDFLRYFSSSFRQVLFLVFPMGILFFILRAQIVRIILGTGKFSWEDTRLTAAALGLFGLSIFAQALILLLARAFYAAQNTKTPVFIQIFITVINIVLSFIFVYILNFDNFFKEFLASALKLRDIKNIAVLGLPLAFSLAQILNLFWMIVAFNKKILVMDLKNILKSFLKILISSIVMGIASYGSLYLIAPFVDMDTFIGVFLQVLGAFLVGVGVFFLFSFILESPEISTFKNLIGKKIKTPEEFISNKIQ